MIGSRSFHISLPVQLVSMVVGLVFFIISAMSIPFILLLRDQLDRQAWLLVEQGHQTTQAIISAQKNHLANLAILTAQRPTLATLIQQGDPDQIASYLQMLKSGAELDLILLCDVNDRPLAQSGLAISTKACSTQDEPSVFFDPEPEAFPGWLLAAHSIADLQPNVSVIVGWALDKTFLEHLHDHTGLDYILLAGETEIASSFPEGKNIWRTIAPQLSGDTLTNRSHSTAQIITVQEIPFYTIRSRLDDTNVVMLIFLSASETTQLKQRFTWMFGAGILAILLVSSLFGVLFARRIGLPLESLRRSATALRGGDLSTPVSVRTKLLEINQVAYALEDARIALQHSLATLRKEKEWADHLLKSIVEGIVVLDRHDRITFFSPGAERIFGWSQEMVMYKHIDEVFQLSDGHESLSEILQVSGRKQTIVTVFGNNRRLTLAITSARLVPPDTGKTGTALVLRDISNEEAIHRLLGGFLANITHEFRTPLSALAASTELLLEQLPTLSQSELSELLGSLRLGILNLQTLIDNLLEGASIEAGRFRVFPRQTDLFAVVQEIIHTMQPLFEKYRQRLVVNIQKDLPRIWADPRRTGQVLVNLLSNAIKMSPPGSEISLSTSVSERTVKVCVGDQGPGIPVEQRQDIFNRYIRVPPSDNRAEHGAGLGLSVVKAIVEAQDGEVGVTDRPGGGAIFWFTLPIAEFTLDREEKRS